MEQDPTRVCELLVGLGDVDVVGVDDEVSEPLVVHVRTRSRPRCSGCGRGCSKGTSVVRLVDFPAFGRPVRLVWHKWRWRWRCPASGCATGSFTETNDVIAPVRSALTTRARPQAWRDRIAWGALDLSGTYRRTFDVALPHSGQVADPFGVIRLADNTIDEVRRRVQNDTLGHRGRKGDPLYRARRLLIAAKVDGNTITQIVETDETTAYPVVADPHFTWGWLTGTVYFNKWETLALCSGSFHTLNTLVILPFWLPILLAVAAAIFVFSCSARLLDKTSQTFISI